jgi:hypothetical protein
VSTLAAVVCTCVGLSCLTSGCSSQASRESFPIASYHFDHGSVVVEAQQPGDPGCFIKPQLLIQVDDRGVHLQVTYLRTSQKFCILPCPIDPVVLRQVLPERAAGRPVIVEPAEETGCLGFAGGPSTVPRG